MAPSHKLTAQGRSRDFDSPNGRLCEGYSQSQKIKGRACLVVNELTRAAGSPNIYKFVITMT